MAPALGAEIFSRGFRFLPTPLEAVTYYLPRLAAGEPLHDAVRPVVHHADVHACAPADLARRFCPLPRTGDRFFFTPSAASRKRGAAQASRAGSWHSQTTTDIKGREDAKVGDLRKLRYKKSGDVDYTDWLMDEYSSGCESQFVLCKMYVSPRAAPTSQARQESAAYFSTVLLPPPVTPAQVVMQPAAAPKRPAPAAAPKRPAPPQDAMSPPCAKRMRGPAVLPAPPLQHPAPPAATLPSLAAVRNMPRAPPQPSAPRRGSTTPSATQPSPASAPWPAPPSKTRPPLAAVRLMSFAPPPQPFAPPRGSTTPLSTQPSSASPPVPPATPTRAPLAAVRKLSFAPPRPSCAPRLSSTTTLATQPSPASDLPVPPPPPTRAPLAAVRKMPLTPPQPSCAPRRTQPSPASAPPPVPIRSAMQPHHSPTLLPTPAQPLPRQVPLPPTPPVARACHVPVQSKQRRILDPFEAAMLRDEAEEQTVPAAPHQPPTPAATPALQDEDEGDWDEGDWDDLTKALEMEEAVVVPTAPHPPTPPAATPALQDEDEGDWDDLAEALEF